MSSPDQSEIIAAMPALARRLVTVVGFRPALILLKQFVGSRLYVPKAAKGKVFKRLSALLGVAGAQALVAALGGRQFDVPNLTALERLFRDRALLADAEAGMSVEALVDKYRMTDRSVRRKFERRRRERQGF